MLIAALVTPMMVSARPITYCIRYTARSVRSWTKSSTLIGEKSGLFEQSAVDAIDAMPSNQADSVVSNDGANQEDDHDHGPTRLSKRAVYQNYYPGRQFARGLPKSYEEYVERRRLPVLQPDNARQLRVAVVGMPNAGKSTLTNQLIGTHVSAVSSRVHTTRNNITGILVDGTTQIEFCDTPGIVQPQRCKKDKLETSFLTAPIESGRFADVIMVIVDASNKRYQSKINDGLLRLLEKHSDKESLLILNKIDAVKAKQRLIDMSTALTNGVVDGVSCFEGDPLRVQRDARPYMATVIDKSERRLREKGTIIDVERAPTDYEPLPQIEETVVERPIAWQKFSRVFMVSAITGDGVDDLRRYLLDKSRPGRCWKYNESTVTTQSPRTLVKEIVKEKLLDHCPQEVPYETSLSIQTWTVTAVGTLCVSINVWAATDNHMTIILGPRGENIARIADEARQVLANTFECDVALKLLVKKQQKRNRKRTNSRRRL